MNWNRSFPFNSTLRGHRHGVIFDTVPVGALELFYSLVGTPLNIIVIIFAKRACQREMARHQVLVMSMATADLVLTSFHCMVMFLRYGVKVDIIPEIAVSVYILTFICTISSSLSLLLLNMDKFIYVYQPLRYEAIVTRLRLFVAIVLAWTTSAGFTGLILFGPCTEFDGVNFQPTNIELYITFMILFFVVPNVISSLTSTCIVIIVARHKQQMKSQSLATFSSIQEGLDFISTTGPPRHRKIPFKSIVFVFSATLWSMVTTLPYRLGFTLQRLQITNSFTTVFALFALMGMNPVVNPIITLATHKPYRRRIRRFLSRRTQGKYAFSKTVTNGQSRPSDYF